MKKSTFHCIKSLNDNTSHQQESQVVSVIVLLYCAPNSKSPDDPPPPPLMAMSVVCALFLSPKINSHCAGTGVSTLIQDGKRENPYNGLLAIREEMYMNFQSSRLCDTGHLTSVRLKREKDLKNATRILILWSCKLSIYPTSWKSNWTLDSCYECSKIYESAILFSGLPKFVYQGCHILLGCNDPNSILPQDVG